MNTFGTCVRLTLFGSSRGPCVGCVLDGLPVGLELDMQRLQEGLSRRAAKRELDTPRREAEAFTVLSGLYNGKTDGTPFAALMENGAAGGAEYPVLRPSHADYAARMKYQGYNDPRGGGMFSGRMSAPLTLAGEVARQALEARGVLVGAHVFNIGDVYDAAFDAVKLARDTLNKLQKSDFPLLDESVRPAMQKELAAAAAAGDSLGGSVECAAMGLPVGCGEPFFDSLESQLSHILFSIPGVKGLEFGAGFGFCSMRGSRANDGLYAEGGRVQTHTNNSGGINGGLANGMPLTLRLAFRPVPTINLPQATLDGDLNAVTAKLSGHNDVCILPRGVAAVEAAVCLALLDMLERM